MPSLCRSKTPHEQDGRWSWLVCFAGTMCWAAVVGLVFSFGVFFPVFMKVFNEDRERTAWVGSLSIAMLFLTGPLSGILVNRLGCRVTTLLGSLICAASLSLASLSESLVALYLSYSIPFGVGTSFVFQACLVVVSNYFTKRRSLATGLVAVGQGLGVLVYGPFLQALIDNYGWKITYRVLAALVFGVCLLGLTFDPNVKPETRDVQNLIKKDDERREEPRRRRRFCLDVSVWRVPAFVAITVSSSIAQFAHYIPPIHLIRFCEELGLTADRASTLYIYLGLSSAIARIIAGRVCDVKSINPFYVYQAGELITGLSIILATLSTSYTGMVIFAVFYGFCDGIFITTLNVLLLTCVEESKRPASLGWMMLFCSAFQASGPPIAGLMADRMGSYNGAFYMAGGVVMFGAAVPFVLCFIKKDVQQDAQEHQHNPSQRQEIESLKSKVASYSDVNQPFSCDQTEAINIENTSTPPCDGENTA